MKTAATTGLEVDESRCNCQQMEQSFYEQGDGLQIRGTGTVTQATDHSTGVTLTHTQVESHLQVLHSTQQQKLTSL